MELSSRRAPRSAPMNDMPSFAGFLTQLRNGDNPAVIELYERFARRLIGLARKRLDERLRGKVGPEDVFNSAVRSVVMRLQAGQFQLDDWGGLWGLLVTVTLRKCGKWRDHYLTEGRDVRREVGKSGGDDGPIDSPDGDAASPSDALEMEEALSRALEGLDEQQREVVRLSLEGHEVNDIARQLGCSYHRAWRALKFVGERLERMRDSE